MDTSWALLPPLMLLAASPRAAVFGLCAPLALAGTVTLRRAARTRSHWDRRVLALPLVGCALAVVFAPLPGRMASARIERILTTMAPDEGRSNAILQWGETACADADIAEALDRAAALPEPLQEGFIDGCAHSLALDVHDPVQAATRIEMSVPPRWRPFLHEAALRRVARRVGLDPDALLPALDAYVAAVPGLDPRNAVRTALQWELGDDLDAALALALRYPADWQPALLEELGWRAGDGRSGTDTARLAGTLPAAVRCSFIRGAVRGRVLRQPEGAPWTWAEIDAWRRPLPGCTDDQAMGVAWALHIEHAGDAEEMWAAAGQIPDDALKTAVLDSFLQLGPSARGGQLPTLWE